MVSFIVIFCLLAFALTIDYSLSLISTVAYWVDMGGNPDLSGLIFGLYDASTIIVVPILSFYLESGGSYKKMFIMGLAINIFGEVFYALANVAESWEMILAGRLIAGLGATVLPMIMVYMVNNISYEDQPKSVGYVKYTAAFSRFIGPVIGSIITVAKGHDDSGLGKLFNVYTLAGWIPICVGLVTMVLLVKYFNEEGINPNTGNVKFCRILSLFWPIQVIGFICTFVYWFFMGNSFIIATHHFNVIHNGHQLWHIYITGLVGFILSFALFLSYKKKVAGFNGLFISFTTLSIGSLIFCFKGNWAFYLGIGVTTFAYGLSIPSINILNNRLAKQVKGMLNNNVAMAVTALTISQSLSRFAGPSMFTATIHINDSNECDFSDPDNYVIGGCEIKGYLTSTIIYISAGYALMVLSFIALIKVFESSKSATLVNNGPDSPI